MQIYKNRHELQNLSLFNSNLYFCRFTYENNLYKSRFLPVLLSLFKSAFYGTLWGVYARARAREQALNKLCLINKHPTHRERRVHRLVNLGGWGGAGIGLRSLRGADFREEGKSTAIAGKQKVRGDAKARSRFLARAWRGVISYAYKLEFFNELTGLNSCYSSFPKIEGKIV